MGRIVELSLLGELVDETRAGTPVTVIICGEAGAGKSRLVAEVTAAARAEGTLVLVGNCSAVVRTSFAFAPFAEALRPLARKLAALKGDGVGRRAAPRLFRLVSESVDAKRTRDPPGPDPLGASAQLGLFEEMLDTLEDAAVPNGVLVVIEDLHWADQSSRGMFDFLSRNLRDTAVALVGTVRVDEPDEAELLAWLAEVQRGPRAIRIDLEPFGREELRDLVAGVLGEPAPVELSDRVYERSGGNAFLAEELLAAAERGVLVPAGVRSLVLARMAVLSGPARGLLRLAAVVGASARHDLLAAAGGLDADDLRSAARELVENHLLVADQSGDGYAFRHALTREAVDDGLLPGERQQLHRAVARALTDQPTLGPSAQWAATEAIAEHWYASGELEHALAASVAAGTAALDVLAVSSALGHYERALALWDRVADPGTVAGVERHVLLERAAYVASGDGQHDRAVDYIDAAFSELNETNAPGRVVGLLCTRKSEYLGRAGRTDEWLEWTGRALALVPSEPPTPELADVLAWHASALVAGAERYEEAAMVASAALEAARRAGARKQEAWAHSALGMCLSMTNTDPEAGIGEFEQWIAIGREVGDVAAVIFGYGSLADELIRLGRLDEAASTGLEAARIGAHLGALRSWVGLGLANAAQALFLAGRWDECERALERLRDQRSGGLIEQLGLALVALLHAHRGNDDWTAAAAAAAASLDIDDAPTVCILNAAQAQLALCLGDLEAAHLAVVAGLDTLSGSHGLPEVVATVALAGVGLQIEADRAILGRARRDRAAEQDAVRSARNIAVRTLAERTRAAAAAHRSEVARSHGALCEAELARAEGRSDPDAWRMAAEASLGEGHRYPVAYARFREAEAVLATRVDRARAIDALTAADAIANELGAEPVRREIEALARRARIELTDGSPQAERNASAEPESAPLGLTARELDVLRLVAAGNTNPQIAEALYISRKTASHHVSSILTKLDVTTRVEAAGSAHRLGLLRPDTAGPE